MEVSQLHILHYREGDSSRSEEIPVMSRKYLYISGTSQISGGLGYLQECHTFTYPDSDSEWIPLVV